MEAGRLPTLDRLDVVGGPVFPPIADSPANASGWLQTMTTGRTVDTATKRLWSDYGRHGPRLVGSGCVGWVGVPSETSYVRFLIGETSVVEQALIHETVAICPMTLTIKLLLWHMPQMVPRSSTSVPRPVAACSVRWLVVSPLLRCNVRNTAHGRARGALRLYHRFVTYAFMRRLESTPARYDRGISLLSGGRIGSVYDRIAELVAEPGADVLDIGCGTGGVSVACANRGANVTGVDRDAGMLEVAASKSSAVEWLELDATEIEDRFGPESLDAVVSCLAFSEMSSQVQDYTLSIALSRLRPGGRLVVADEVAPDRRGQRALYRIRRAPVVAVTWLLTQTTTRPVRDLSANLATLGFVEIETERPWPSFQIIAAVKPS